MPISREAFQIGVPGSQDNAAEEFVDAPEADKGASIADPAANSDREVDKSSAEPTGNSAARKDGNGSAKESPQGIDKEELPNLPPADPTSAEKKEAFGATHPQRETHRSVATGRDVPQFTTNRAQHEGTEINWNEARAETEGYTRRARAQKGAAMEHMARIHDVVELLIEMSEAHSNNGERKLQSLESKVAELETRYAVNRSSP